jgi:hypothetical protein
MEEVNNLQRMGYNFGHWGRLREWQKWEGVQIGVGMSGV